MILDLFLMFTRYIQSFVSYGMSIRNRVNDSHFYRLKITLNRLIKFTLLKPINYNNNSAVHLALDIAWIYELYFRNILVSLYSFKHNATRDYHFNSIRYIENINICVPKFS